MLPTPMILFFQLVASFYDLLSSEMLQPENLLLDANGVLKVSDFGLSALPQQVRVSIYTLFLWLGIKAF